MLDTYYIDIKMWFPIALRPFPVLSIILSQQYEQKIPKVIKRYIAHGLTKTKLYFPSL